MIVVVVIEMKDERERERLKVINHWSPRSDEMKTERQSRSRFRFL